MAYLSVRRLDILGHFGTIRENVLGVRSIWTVFLVISDHLLLVLIETNALQTNGEMDGRTDRQTDRPSYSDAWTHLKKNSNILQICFQYLGPQNKI